MGLVPGSWRALIVVLIVVIVILVALLMALVVATILMVLVGSIGIIISPIIREQSFQLRLRSKLTTHHSNRRSHCLADGARSHVAARHAADIPGDRNTLDCAHPGNKNP